MPGRKSVIRFDIMDKKRALLWGKDPQVASNLEQSLIAKGFKVEMCASPAELFSKLEMGHLGYVLISCGISPITTHPVAELIQKKFSIPILFFAESETSSILGGSLFEMVPEIHYLEEKDPAKVPAEVDDFERVYKEKKAAMLSKMPEHKKDGKDDLVKNLLQLVLNKSQPLKEPLTKEIVSVFHCHVVQDDNMADLYFACPPDKVNSEVQMEIQKTLSTFLGYEIALKKIVHGIEIDKVAALNSDAATISGVWNSVPARVSIMKDTETEVETQDGFIVVPFETWWTQIRSVFRAYLLLKANHKQILYMKAGDLLREESLERFGKKGVKSLGVDPQDYETWRATSHLFEGKKAA